MTNHMFSEVPAAQGNQNELNVLEIKQSSSLMTDRQTDAVNYAFILYTYPRNFMYRLQKNVTRQVVLWGCVVM
jgi:hypothetical protein